MSRHHPNDDTLSLYALGGLKSGANLVVDAHLVGCARCRAAIAGVEAVAGVVLEGDDTAPLSAGALDRALDRLEKPQSVVSAIDLKTLVRRGWWLPAAPGLWFKPLPGQAAPGEKVYLLKAKGGVPLPEHGHSGCERIVVLQGAFEDHDGVHGPGDFAECDDDITHIPTVLPGETCICLAATDGPLRFTGIARLFQPLLGV